MMENSISACASVFVRAVGLCTALHSPPRVALAVVAVDVRPVTATSVGAKVPVPRVYGSFPAFCYEVSACGRILQFFRFVHISSEGV